MRDFIHIPELSGYLDEPKQMASGMPGKDGYLSMVFEKDGERSIMRKLDRKAPLVVQQELYWDEDMPGLPCICIISSAGAVLQGDRNEIRIHMQKDSCAYVTTQSATKVNEMEANFGSQIQELVLEDGAYLEYLPDQTIPHKNTRYITATSLKVAPTATLLYSEMFMSGRKYYGKGERYEYNLLSSFLEAERLDGTPLFKEKFIIRPKQENIHLLGVVQDYDVFANIVLLTPPEHATPIFEQVKCFVDKDRKLAAGISKLPNDSGLIYKILGMESGPVKKLIREFWFQVRKQVKERNIPPEFTWK